MEIKGTIKEIGPTGEYGRSNFKKRQLIIVEDVEKYPQTLPIDFVQDKCALLDNYAEGQKVTIQINLRGNEYNGKHYVSIQGWKIEGEPLQQSAPPEKPSNSVPTATPQQAFAPAEDLNEEDHDDIPF